MCLPQRVGAFAQRPSDSPRAVWTLGDGSRFCGLRSFMQLGGPLSEKEHEAYRYQVRYLTWELLRVLD